MTVDEILALSNKELLDLLIGGHPIDANRLDDTEYRGISLGLPRTVEKLTWKTFKKVFHRDPTNEVLRGWNVRIQQKGIDGPYDPIEKKGEPVTFGHYVVVALDGQPMPHPITRGLLIDYGIGGNKRFDPIGRVRDPIVALSAEDADLILGWSYVSLGSFGVSTPSFFLLQRDGPLTHTVAPPGRPTYDGLRPR